MEYLTIVYYKSFKGDFVIYDTNEDTFYRSYELPLDCNKFELNKKFPAKKSGLKAFYEKLVADNTFIKSCKKDIGILYDIFNPEYKKSNGTIGLFYKMSNSLALNFLKRYVSFASLDYDKVSMTEFQLYEKTYNAGIYYANKGVYKNAYMYDFRMMYPRCMASDKFYFPCYDKGNWVEFKRVQKTNIYKYGIYHCRITVHDENVKKIFMTSKDDHYTHYDLESAHKLLSVYKDSLTIKPLGKAYVYDEDTLEKGSDIFSQWYNALVKLKEKDPKNIIVKTVSSSVWGYLCQKQTKKMRLSDVTDDMEFALDITEITDETTHVIFDYTPCEDDSYSYYDLLHVNDSPQKYPFRLKPFLTSFARLQMVKALMMQLPYVVKINTDGFVMTKRFPDKIKTLIYEGHAKVDVKNCMQLDIVEEYND